MKTPAGRSMSPARTRSSSFADCPLHVPACRCIWRIATGGSLAAADSGVERRLTVDRPWFAGWQRVCRIPLPATPAPEGMWCFQEGRGSSGAGCIANRRRTGVGLSRHAGGSCRGAAVAGDLSRESPRDLGGAAGRPHRDRDRRCDRRHGRRKQTLDLTDCRLNRAYDDRFTGIRLKHLDRLEA